MEEEVRDVEVTLPFECPAQIMCNVQSANARCLGWYQLNVLICLNVMFAMIKFSGHGIMMAPVGSHKHPMAEILWMCGMCCNVPQSGQAS